MHFFIWGDFVQNWKYCQANAGYVLLKVGSGAVLVLGLVLVLKVVLEAVYGVGTGDETVNGLRPQVTLIFLLCCINI